MKPMSEQVTVSAGAESRWAEIATPLLFAIACFIVWEAAVHLLDVALYVLPPPSAIFVQYVRRFPVIWDSTMITALETFVGFGVSILVGIPLALVVAFSPLLRRTLYPFAVTLEMVPKIAFAPVFISWWGLGFQPKIIVVFLVCFFPILLNGILAFTSLGTDLGRFCLSTGAGPVRTFFKVRLPAALPQLFVGIKGAAVNATVGATVAEWIGCDAGLGCYIQQAIGRDSRMDVAFAIIFMLAALGLLVFGLVILAERLLIPWHISQRAPVQGVG